RSIAAAGPSLETLGIRPTPARQRVLAKAARASFATANGLAKAAEVSAGVVADLIRGGALKAIETAPPPLFKPADTRALVPVLEPAQAEAVTALRAAA